MAGTAFETRATREGFALEGRGWSLPALGSLPRAPALRQPLLPPGSRSSGVTGSGRPNSRLETPMETAAPRHATSRASRPPGQAVFGASRLLRESAVKRLHGCTTVAPANATPRARDR